MRELLFRGKRTVNGEWITESDCIMPIHNIRGTLIKLWLKDRGWVDVIPETVSQYTGLTDANGKKIFEEDIVRYSNGFGHIEWAQLHGAFMCVEENGEYWEWLDNMYDIEILGNIHDNPELLT